jgi:transcriptional regulator with XRE-family HTH domain
MPTVGENIRYFREQIGMTQMALARAVGVAPPYVSQLEAGVRDPSLSVARKVAAALGVDVALLVGGKASGEPRRLTRAQKAGMFMALLRDLEEGSTAAAIRGRDAVGMMGSIEMRELHSEQRSFEVFHGTIVDSKQKPVLRSHPGHEVILCLKGELEVILDRKRIRLIPGQSVGICGEDPHGTGGRRGSEAVFIFVPDGPRDAIIRGFTRHGRRKGPYTGRSRRSGGDGRIDRSDGRRSE